jgi:hypothetical protein
MEGWVVPNDAREVKPNVRRTWRIDQDRLILALAILPVIIPLRSWSRFLLT